MPKPGTVRTWLNVKVKRITGVSRNALYKSTLLTYYR